MVMLCLPMMMEGQWIRIVRASIHLAALKGTQLEGGIRVLGLVLWPKVLPAGTVYEQPLSALDLIPIFASAAGGELSELSDLDGVDMLPYLLGEKSERPHDSLHWKMEGRGAIREGDWKLLRFLDRPAQLYNSVEDPAEQNDLAAVDVARVKAMYTKLFAWELELERPLFLLRRAEEGWSSRRATQFSRPPAADY